MNLCVLCFMVVTLCYVPDITKAGEWSGPKWKEKDCGCSKYHLGTQGIQAQVIGGEDAQPHEFPWMVFILYDKFGSKFGCGGTLISECYVLTAAHCVIDSATGVQIPAENYTLYIGDHNLTDAETIERNLIEVISHPDYVISTKACDAALLRLAQPVKFNENVTNICKPDVTTLYENQDVYVTGWGHFDNQGGVLSKFSSILLFGIESVIPNADCGSFFDSIKFMCAEDKDGTPQSPCFGDSGGPAAVKDPVTGKFSLVGISSFVTSGICDVTKPQGFTRITQALLNWIATC